MKKILHVIDTLSVGGAETLLVGIINELPEFENHLLILRDPVLLKPQIKNLASFVNLKTTSFRGALTKIPAVRKLMREGGYDIVHSHLYESNIVSRLSVPKTATLFNSIHAVSSQASYNQSKTSLWLERLTYKKRHRLIHVSQTVRDDFEEHVGAKGAAVVLYNFIEDAFFRHSPKPQSDFKELKLVAVGNLRHQKNYPYLVEAFKKMPPNVSLDVYGEGRMRSELQAEVDKHSLNISFKGLRNNLHRILPRYDLFVMSSHFEGQPVALLEAMACGLPALLSDIPVLREAGGDIALYFDLADPEDLVKKVSEITGGKHDLPGMSLKGIRFATENARKDNYINKLKSLYFSVP